MTFSHRFLGDYYDTNIPLGVLITHIAPRPSESWGFDGWPPGWRTWWTSGCTGQDLEPGGRAGEDNETSQAQVTALAIASHNDIFDL